MCRKKVAESVFGQIIYGMRIYQRASEAPSINATESYTVIREFFALGSWVLQTMVFYAMLSA